MVGHCRLWMWSHANSLGLLHSVCLHVHSTDHSNIKDLTPPMAAAFQFVASLKDLVKDVKL